MPQLLTRDGQPFNLPAALPMDHDDMMLEAAIECVERGWRIFPVWGVDGEGVCRCPANGDCGSPGKHPMNANGHKGASSDPAIIEGWWDGPYKGASIGLACDDGVWALDVDPDKDGDASLNRLEKEFGPLPETITCLTGGGGMHYYLKHDGTPIKNATNLLGPGLDIRSDGYTVLPPSPHKSGKRYEWQADNGPDDIEPAKAPAWIVDRVRKDAPKETPSTVVAAPAGSTTAYGEKALKEECQKVRGATDGEQEATLNSAGLKIGGLVASRAVDFNEARTRLTEAGMAMPSFAAPWRQDEVVKKVERALRDGMETPRGPQPTALGDGAPVPPGAVPPQPTDTHLPIDWATCLGDPPVREWTWRDVVPRGYVSSMYGPGGSGKTLLAQQLSTRIALPHEGNLPPTVLGRPVRTGPVLALFAEDDQPELWRRQDAINRHYGCSMGDLKDLHIISGFGENNLLMTFDKQVGKLTPLYDHFLNMALELHPELIVIDNAADTFAGVENDRAAVTQFLKSCLGGLARKTGAGVLLLAHPSVAGMKSGDGSGGSTGWTNSVRMRTYLEPMSQDEADAFDPDVRYLSDKKTNLSQRGLVNFTLRWKDGVFVEENDPSKGGVVGHIDAQQKRDIVFSEFCRVVDGGERVSQNTRAGNYVAKRLLDCQPIRAAKLGRSKVANHIDALLKEGRIKIEEYNERGRCHQKLVPVRDDTGGRGG